MALRLPPLSALRLFEAAGRHESFKLAAEELHLTPSAVSHGIVALERWLGVDLFTREPRGVRLTDAGRDYLPFVSEALAMVAVGTRRLPSRHGIRRISISVTPTFAIRWLIPRLPAFHRKHPDIQLSIDTSHRQVGFPVDDVDLAIRMARAPWPGLSSTLLFSEALLPVCSPAFAAAWPDRSQLDFTKTPLIHIATVTEDWAAWAEQSGASGLDLSRGLRVDTVQLALSAAAAGLGVAMGRRPFVDEDIAAGRLVAIGPTVPISTGYWLIRAAQAEGRADIAAFSKWLVEAAGGAGVAREERTASAG